MLYLVPVKTYNTIKKKKRRTAKQIVTRINFSLPLTDDAAFVLNQFFLLKDKLNHALHVNRSGYGGRHECLSHLRTQVNDESSHIVFRRHAPFPDPLEIYRKDFTLFIIIIPLSTGSLEFSAPMIKIFFTCELQLIKVLKSLTMKRFIK